MTPGIRITLRFTFHASRIKIKRGQVILRHTELTAYRCFLPDLAGFTGFCRTGPSPYLSLEVRSQGGSSRRNYPTPLRFTSHVFIWRRGWDSNPRSHCWDACFPSMSIRPLSHLSAPIFARRHLNTRSDDRQGDRSGHRHGIDPPGSPSYTANHPRGGVAMRILIGQGILIVLLMTAFLSLPFLIDPTSIKASTSR